MGTGIATRFVARQSCTALWHSQAGAVNPCLPALLLVCAALLPIGCNLLQVATRAAPLPSGTAAVPAAHWNCPLELLADCRLPFTDLCSPEWGENGFANIEMMPDNTYGTCFMYYVSTAC